MFLTLTAKMDPQKNEHVSWQKPWFQKSLWESQGGKDTLSEIFDRETLHKFIGRWSNDDFIGYLT
jgi:hypothetical protein